MQQSPEAATDRWSSFVRDFNTSSLEFYSAVENEVRERHVPDIKVSRKAWSEGGILSANREYLIVDRGTDTFAICAAPFGKDFFFSWWLLKPQPKYVLFAALAVFLGVPFAALLLASKAGFFKGLFYLLLAGGLAAAAHNHTLHHGGSEWDATLRAVPLFGTLYARIFRTETYYTVDTSTMFRESIRRIVEQRVSELVSLQARRSDAPHDTVIVQ